MKDLLLDLFDASKAVLLFIAFMVAMFVFWYLAIGRPQQDCRDRGGKPITDVTYQTQCIETEPGS